MKKVKSLNKWVIKEKNSDEAISPNQVYGIFAPDGRFMEDNLTFEQAIDFAESNEDFVTKCKKAKFNRSEFLLYINEGVWFKDEEFGDLVYLRPIENGGIISVNLTMFDPESMAFEEYKKGEWNWDEDTQTFNTYGAGVYHFGQENIYTEDSVVIEDKLIGFIWDSYENRTYKIFESKDAIQNMWDLFKTDEHKKYRTLNFKSN